MLSWNWSALIKYLSESWATCRWRNFWNWCINWFAELDRSNRPARSSCARLSWMFSTSASDHHSSRSISSDYPLVRTRWSIDLRPKQLSGISSDHDCFWFSWTVFHIFDGYAWPRLPQSSTWMLSFCRSSSLWSGPVPVGLGLMWRRFPSGQQTCRHRWMDCERTSISTVHFEGKCSPASLDSDPWKKWHRPAIDGNWLRSRWACDQRCQCRLPWNHWQVRCRHCVWSDRVSYLAIHHV